MLTSIVIATYNRRELLAHTLPSVLAQNYPPERYEVVLVVDGSTDGTAEYVRSLNPSCALEVIEQDNRGPAAARNAGIAASSGDLVLFLDDDIRCEPRLLQEHAEGHAAEDGVLVHGALFLAPESPRTLAACATGAWYEQHNAEVAAAGGLRPDRNVYLNANSSVAKSVLEDLGGFDESVPFPREDFELGLRIWKAGIPLRYRPEAMAYEVFSKPSRQFVRADAVGQAQADVVICRKHPDYRSHSALAPHDPPTMLDTALRRAFHRLPRGVERMLDPGVEVSERLIDLSPVRRLGLRLLAVQRRIVFERAASAATGSARAFEHAFDRKLAVLLYHRVGPAIPGLHPALTVSPTDFERQVAWLRRRGYRGIRPSQWQDWLEGRGTLPRKPVLFTFDDGYAEIVEHALPVLRRHGFGALVFVVTGMLGEAMSWDAEGRAVDGPPLMSADEVAHLAREGVDFGAHGRTHRDLTELSENELDDEVRGSHADLEQITGGPVACFAYPFGRYDDRVHKSVSSTYDLAFTTERGVNGLATPPHLLRRSGVGPTDSLLDIEWRARNGHVPLRRTRDFLRIRARAQAFRGGPAKRPWSSPARGG